MPLVREGRESVGRPDDLNGLVAATEGLQPWRRVFHALSGVVLAGAPRVAGLDRPSLLGLLAGALLVALTLDLLRLRRPDANAVFFRAFRRLASPREAHRIASSTWYVLGALIAYALFPPDAAATGILVLAFADPSASVLGRLYGRHSLGKGSVEGTLVFFTVASVIVLAAGFGVAGLIAAALVAVAEILPSGLDDNLVVPLVAGAALTLLG